MRTIRYNVFESNSSSTHSLAIPKESSDTPNHLSFYIGEFDWGWDEVSPTDYFYTAIYETSDTADEVAEKLEKLTDILDVHEIRYHFGEARTHIWNSDNGINYISLDNGYIDHGGELRAFVDELLNNGNKFIRFLSEGLVFTGNDNCDTAQRGFVERDTKYFEDHDWRTKTISKIENPYYMEDYNNYEWYWKGN
jgi:hypothetical protein